MTTARRQVLLKIFKLFDIGLMMVSFVVASLPFLRASHADSLTQFFAMRIKLGNFAMFLALVLFWHFCFNLFGLYESRRLSSRLGEAIDVVQATALGSLIILGVGLLFQIRMITVAFVSVFWVVSTLSAILSRLLMRTTLASVRRQGLNLRQVLIVGTNERARAFCRSIESRPELGFRVIGFVDEDRPGFNRTDVTGHDVVSDFSGITHFLRNNVVDEVVVALPMRSLHAEASEIALGCEEQGIPVRLLPDIFNLKRAKPKAEQWEGDHPHITHHAGFAEGWQVWAKRGLDLTASSIALLLLSPMLFVVAALIKITSPGQVFFMQERVGLNKRRFKIFKFRTMVADAEKRIKDLEHMNEVTGPVFKIKNDPRITPMGAFLRKTSIDELPQLINVVLGDMSLVGPRPLPVRDYEGFSKDWQRRRFSVRPGITCLWQVMGRSSIPFERWMELDLEYIDQWSLWLDLSILVRTIPAVLRGSGAA
jgi:exopolysaccharide biosynthesis polyprenyl glycosylphosphotransferase